MTLEERRNQRLSSRKRQGGNYNSFVEPAGISNVIKHKTVPFDIESNEVSILLLFEIILSLTIVQTELKPNSSESAVEGFDERFKVNKFK